MQFEQTNQWHQFDKTAKFDILSTVCKFPISKTPQRQQAEQKGKIPACNNWRDTK